MSKNVQEVDEMKYDVKCGACIRSYLAEGGIGCVSISSAISVFLSGEDQHDGWCKVKKNEQQAARGAHRSSEG